MLLYPLTASWAHRKDKTLVEILERIKSLESKIDDLSLHTNFPTTSPFAAAQTPAFAPATSLGITPGIHGPPINPSFPLPEPSSATSGTEDHYHYVSSVHQMLAWPGVQGLLATVQPKVPSFDLSLLERDISIPPLNTQGHNVKALPTRTAVATGPPMDIRGQVHGSASIPLSSLNWDAVQRLSKAYFDTFNLLFPILDRRSFLSNMLPSLFNRGFGQEITSTVAFLVFALGEVALAGTEGHPIHVHTHNGRPSGIKGGSKDEPPGLELFNEARKRMGFSLTECSLENVQIFALARYELAHPSCLEAMGS